MNQVFEALLTSAGILWKAFWALVFGYAISAAIQVLVTRSQMARILSKRGPKRVSPASTRSSATCPLANSATTFEELYQREVLLWLG